MTFLAAFVISFTFELFAITSFHTKVLFVVRIFLDVAQFSALMATVKTDIAWSWAMRLFRIFATVDYNFVFAAR